MKFLPDVRKLLLFILDLKVIDILFDTRKGGSSKSSKLNLHPIASPIAITADDGSSRAVSGRPCISRILSVNCFSKLLVCDSNFSTLSDNFFSFSSLAANFLSKSSILVIALARRSSSVCIFANKVDEDASLDVDATAGDKEREHDGALSGGGGRIVDLLLHFLHVHESLLEIISLVVVSLNSVHLKCQNLLQLTQLSPGDKTFVTFFLQFAH